MRRSPPSRGAWDGRGTQGVRGPTDPAFLDDLEECGDYISDDLASPLAARKMYMAVREKIVGLAIMPESATSYVSPVSGRKRHKVSYNRYDIH